jgi:acetyl esterase
MMSVSRPSSEMMSILNRLAVEDAGLPDPTLLSPKEGRAQAAASNERWRVDLPEMARVQDVVVAGPAGDIPCRIMTPKGKTRGTILFIHGGGWAFCSMDTHDRCARFLAIEAKATIVLCDYRLAPENPYPAGLDDCRAVWSALASGAGVFAGQSGPFAFSGDSAGANLAMALMLEDGPKPDCGLLFYGVYGADFETESYNACADGPGLSREKMKRYWEWYAPDKLRNQPQLTPLCASDEALKALPQLYLNAAEIDPLRSDSQLFFARLSALGREDKFRLHGGVVHGFMQMTNVLEEARIAVADAGEAFRFFTAEKKIHQTESR